MTKHSFNHQRQRWNKNVHFHFQEFLCFYIMVGELIRVTGEKVTFLPEHHGRVLQISQNKLIKDGKTECKSDDDYPSRNHRYFRNNEETNFTGPSRYTINNITLSSHLHNDQLERDRNSNEHMYSVKTEFERSPNVLLRTSRQSSRSNKEEQKLLSCSSQDLTPRNGHPITYRYWNRSRTRSSRSDSFPFIILGPNVDHWKTVGKILASRGFNVMACQRTKQQQEERLLQEERQKVEEQKNDLVKSAFGSQNESEGEMLVSSVLHALKWPNAILVGCDNEAILAIEAALTLSPDKVAGLVLCGDLSSIASIEHHIYQQMKFDGRFVENSETIDGSSIDSLLSSNIHCPISIICDGDFSTWSRLASPDLKTSTFPSRDVDGGRSVIIGGGLAPHLRLPEQFAWTLTRFVENKVSPRVQVPILRGREQSLSSQSETSILGNVQSCQTKSNAAHFEHNFIINGRKNDQVKLNKLKAFVSTTMNKVFHDILAPAPLLVTGRVIASAIVYLSITKISIFQYQKFRGFHHKLSDLDNLLALPGIFLNHLWTQTKDRGINHNNGKVEENKIARRKGNAGENPRANAKGIRNENIEFNSNRNEVCGDGVPSLSCPNDAIDVPNSDFELDDERENQNHSELLFEGKKSRQQKDENISDTDCHLLDKFLFFDQIIS